MLSWCSIDASRFSYLLEDESSMNAGSLPLAFTVRWKFSCIRILQRGESAALCTREAAAESKNMEKLRIAFPKSGRKGEAQPAMPSSIQRLNSATLSFDQGSSQGILPSSKVA
jgi:hypothetical protein